MESLIEPRSFVRVSTRTGWSKISTFKVLLQHIPKKFSIPLQQNNSVLFQCRQLTKFEEFQIFAFLAQIATKMTKNLRKFRTFLQNFRTALKNRYYFRTFRKIRTPSFVHTKLSALKVSKFRPTSPIGSIRCVSAGREAARHFIYFSELCRLGRTCSGNSRVH